MKRAIGVLVVGLLTLGASPVTAGDGEPPVTVSPNPVRHGMTLQIVAADCESGDTWEAFVEILIQNEAGMEKHNSYAPADPSGTTTTSIKIKKSKYAKGLYSMYIACIHEFDDGTTGVWYETQDIFKVKRKRRSHKAVSGGDAPVSVPSSVRQGKMLHIVADDCEDQEGSTAQLYISIIKDGELVYDFHGAPDPGGKTQKNIKVKKSKFPTGDYDVYVDCIQVYEDGMQEPSYNHLSVLTVKKAKKKY